MKLSFGSGAGNNCVSLLLSRAYTYGACFSCNYILSILYYNVIVLLSFIVTLMYLRFICVIVLYGYCIFIDVYIFVFPQHNVEGLLFSWP